MLRHARVQGVADGLQVLPMARDLHDAWETAVGDAKTAFPSVAERALLTCPANWVEKTQDGELAMLSECPERMQRMVSRAQNRLTARMS